MKRKVLLLSLTIGLLSVGSAMAQSSIGFRAIGASAAFVSPEDVDGTLGFGVFADLGQITPQIKLEPAIEFWSKSEEAFGTEASIRDIAVGARAKYFFSVTNPKLHPFAGAGAGLHFLKAETTVSIPGFATVSGEASDTKFGLDLGGGMETAIGPKNDLRFEAWYGVVSDMSQFALRIGVSHKLGM